MLQASWRVYAAGAVPNRIYLLGLTSARSKLWELRSMPSRMVSARQLRGRAACNMFVAGLWLFIFHGIFGLIHGITGRMRTVGPWR